MIDLKLLQKDFDFVSSQLQRKGVGLEIIESIKEKNEALKKAKMAYESAQADQNEMSRLFGLYRREGRDTAELKSKVDTNKITVTSLQDQQREAEEALTTVIMAVPNMPDSSVPDGTDEEDNVEIRKVLTPRTFSFTPKEHWELADKNGWIDFERGVKVAKSR
ncbi:MAG: serine--tRNA ligase, partial [Thiovulaceae bacterium]|nr:serine--tRNA ligase [Sulfurimonadaceae bacterium]